jgi:fructokinase
LEAPRVKVADTVGAGDTFTAGFLRYLQRNGLLTKKAMGSIEATQLMHAAEFAMKCAAITVSRVGADPPWANEV